jgi:hypothetical protein
MLVTMASTKKDSNPNICQKRFKHGSIREGCLEECPAAPSPSTGRLCLGSKNGASVEWRFSIGEHTGRASHHNLQVWLAMYDCHASQRGKCLGKF